MTRVRAACALFITLLFAGCYHYDVDTFEKHCERIGLIDRGLDQLEIHTPFWAIFPSISFHQDAIRDGFIAWINRTHMEKVGNSMPRMAWREGFEFHLVNMSTFLVKESGPMEPSEIVDGWRTGIERANALALKDPAEKCIYQTAADYFESMIIHSTQSNEVIVIPTERQARYKKYGWPPP